MTNAVAMIHRCAERQDVPEEYRLPGYDLPAQGPWARHFGGGAPKAPPPPPPPPSKTDAEIQAEKAKAAKVARGRTGRGASILTDETAGFLQPSDAGGKATLG